MPLHVSEVRLRATKACQSDVRLSQMLTSPNLTGTRHSCVSAGSCSVTLAYLVIVLPWVVWVKRRRRRRRDCACSSRHQPLLHLLGGLPTHPDQLNPSWAPPCTSDGFSAHILSCLPINSGKQLQHQRDLAETGLHGPYSSWAPGQYTESRAP